MTYHYPDLGSATDWLKQIPLVARPIRNTIKIWIVTRHQYGEITDGVTKCRLVSQAKFMVTELQFCDNLVKQQRKP